jgi:hypothetical protein
MRIRSIAVLFALLPLACRAGWSQLATSPDHEPISNATTAPQEDK